MRNGYRFRISCAINLESVIKPEKRVEYEREKGQWFPRDDTAENRAFDKRTPGLFKIEWEGEGIIALCSKTYFCFGDQNKVSCKGLNKKTNEINKDTYYFGCVKIKESWGWS